MMTPLEVEEFLNQLALLYEVPKPKVIFNCERHCSGPKIDNRTFLCGMIACCNESLGNTINFKSGIELTKPLIAHEFGHYLFHVRNPGICQAYINEYHRTHPECDSLARELGSTFGQLYPRREIKMVKEIPLIKGPLGIWPFPFLNYLITRRRLRG